MSRDTRFAVVEVPALTPKVCGKSMPARMSVMAMPTHYVDVSGEPLQKGIASLAAHEQYLAALPDHPTPEEINRGVTEEAGRRLGIEAALPVREVRL